MLIEQDDCKRCEYCGSELQPHLYFCSSCSRPYKTVESLIPRPLPAYMDDEMRVRKSTKAWDVFFWFLGALLLGFVLGLIFGGNDNRSILYVCSSLCIAVTAFVFSFIEWGELKSQLASLGFGKPAVWLGLLALVPLLVLNYGYHSWVEQMLPYLEMEDYSDVIPSRLGLIILICVMPAITEEISFRGIIQNEFEKVLTPWKAILIASCLFSAMHFSLISAPYLLLVGCLLGYLRWRSGSLYPSMVAHFIHNFVVITYFS